MQNIDEFQNTFIDKMWAAEWKLWAYDEQMKQIWYKMMEAD